MALLRSADPCSAAAVFTTNAFQAAPVVVSRRAVASGRPVSGVVVNAGCANACTGARGLADAEEMAGIAAAGDAPALVMSTGVIGQYLPMGRVRDGVRAAAGALDAGERGWRAASEAIMTTDTLPKLVSRRSACGAFSLAGMSKGSGMIHPSMATMLAVVATDAAVSPACLDAALRHANARSFNCISVDGDTSTNDTLCVLANGAAGGAPIDDPRSDAFARFRDELTGVATELAKLIVRDGEGATKFVEVRVRGAASEADARAVGNSVVRSPLVKTALYGRDANWGRIACAVGYSGVSIVPERVNIWFRGAAADGSEDLHVFRDGAPHPDEELAAVLLSRTDVTLDIDVGMGAADQVTMWTSDLTHDYVTINGDYRS